ncbi:MAG: OmpA family protein [Bacteroidia bacterium]|nr:OmpA family protein [Bacteroidia bacterium]
MVSEVSTFAGGNGSGFVDGLGTSARLNGPNGIAMDGNGNIYFSDDNNNAVRKITTNGTVTTLAGNGIAGFKNGLGKFAQFNGPKGLAVDKFGNVFVADYNNHCIRKITPDGIVSVFAGVPLEGFQNGETQEARFRYPIGLCIDKARNLYVMDMGNNAIRKITPEGKVTTIAGNGLPGYADGQGSSAQFNDPLGICIDANDYIYLVDSRNRCIRMLTTSGKTTTILNSKLTGYRDSTGKVKQLNFANSASNFAGGICTDSKGNLFIADGGSNTIVQVDLNRKVLWRLAGTGSVGLVNGHGEDAQFYDPVEICHNGKDASFVCDFKNHAIRKITITYKYPPPPQQTKPKEEIVLKGTVTDAKTNAPLSAEIKLIATDTIAQITLRTLEAKGGTFSQIITPNTWNIEVKKEGYLPYSYSVPKPTGTYNHEIVVGIKLNKIEKNAKLVMRNVYFKYASAELLEESYYALNQIADFLKENPNLKIRIAGHTDRGGTPDYNLRLSEARAKKIVDYLIVAGVPKTQLSYIGYGNTRPVASNDTEEGRSQNRRVEFEITDDNAK